jgi:hypothetical protein
MSLRSTILTAMVGMLGGVPLDIGPSVRAPRRLDYPQTSDEQSTADEKRSRKAQKRLRDEERRKAGMR